MENGRERVDAYFRVQLGCEQEEHPAELLDAARELRPGSWVQAVRWAQIADPRRMELPWLEAATGAAPALTGFPPGAEDTDAQLLDTGKAPATWAAAQVSLAGDMGVHLVSGLIESDQPGSELPPSIEFELQVRLRTTEIGWPDLVVLTGTWDSGEEMAATEIASIQQRLAFEPYRRPGPSGGPRLDAVADNLSVLLAHTFVGYGDLWPVPGVPVGVGAVWEAPDGHIRCDLESVEETSATIECNSPADQSVDAVPAASRGTVRIHRQASSPVPSTVELERSIEETLEVDGTEVVATTRMHLSLRPHEAV